MQATQSASPKSARRPLILVALLFILPVLVAVGFYLSPSLLSLVATKNHGILVEPPRPLSALALKTADGTTLDHAQIVGRWTYWIFNDGTCDRTCEERLYRTRQVRLALGKDVDKAQRLLVALADRPAAQADPEENPDLTNAATGTAPGWAEAFLQGEESLDISQIYLSDPFGNLMMRYPPEISGPDILKDLKRLVHVSWVQPK
ncbi:MAG: hypothetical protein ABFS23_02130 [Pseudomonadota bacterium]